MTLKKTTQRLAQQLFGAIAFYTTIPISARWTLDFTRIARWSTFVGLLIGASLAVSDVLLQPYFPIALRSGMVVMIWIAMTGALHLDGAMDAADALGVWDKEKRLVVMADSRAGAFGVIAAIAIILLKVSALTAVTTQRWLLLLWLPLWGRWAHILAVGQYPYLKPQGKARIHHDGFQPRWDYLPSLLLGISMGLSLCLTSTFPVQNFLILLLISGLVSWATGYAFYRRFEGVTGDIHGAIVEWTETILLLSWVGIMQG